MKFGEKLASSIHEPWAPYYIDYAQLKALLKEETGGTENLAEQEQIQSHGGGSILQPLQSPTRNGSNSSLSALSMAQWSLQGLPGFVVYLSEEVERILFFFLQEQARVASELEACRQIQLVLQRQDSSLWLTSQSTTSTAVIETDEEEELLVRKYYHVAVHLLRLIQYVDLNITGIRKILKKHDKRFHSTLSTVYLGKRATILAPMVSNESLDALTKVLESSLKEWIQFVAERRKVFQDIKLLDTLDEEDTSHAISQPYQQIQSQSITASPRNAAFPFPSDENPKVVLLQIKAARSRLQDTSDFLKMLAAPVFLLEDGSQEEDFDADEQEEQGREISNFLNYMSTFLYMANYYIVAPASNTYAEKLGGDASQAGIIIGMTPVAALVSTLLYSWWTSHSYKSALIFASVCSCIGNLCYGAGLPMNSLNIVLLGRLWNGFGSARSINRRYVADAYSRQERTAASAAFVAAGALGMSLGPAIAAMLEFTVHDSDDDDSTYNVYWQVENAPGWIMFAVWMVYLFFLICFFRDPPRRKRRNKSDDELQTEHILVPEHGSETRVERNVPHVAWKNVVDENQPLLLTHSNTPNEESTRSIPLYPHNYTPVIVTFVIYFVLKLILESILSSSPMITSFYFGWTGKLSGLYLAILGLLLLPANWLVGYLSNSYDDRELVLAIQICMLVGCVAVLNIYGAEDSPYSLCQYLVASILIFVSTNALEGPNMSLLSKTIPKSWSEGFFNVGLLATEAGTLGRAVGDVLLTLFGSTGLDFLLNRIFGVMTGLSFLCIVLSVRFFSDLLPPESED